LGLPSPPSGDLGGFGAVKKTTSFNICSGYPLQSFLPQRQAKKDFRFYPGLSRFFSGSPSAENLYSAFTEA
jgi:hypothetical protein